MVHPHPKGDPGRPGVGPTLAARRRFHLGSLTLQRCRVELSTRATGAGGADLAEGSGAPLGWPVPIQQPHDQRCAGDRKQDPAAVSPEQKPADQATQERATKPQQDGRSDAHRIRAGNRKPPERTHNETRKDEGDEIADHRDIIAHPEASQPNPRTAASFALATDPCLEGTLFALVVVHALFYGALRRMTSPFTRILIATVVAVLVGQAIGVWRWRRHRRRAAASST